jgi:hypothetical protein
VAVDERARVPFALVAVVLLVGSTTLAVSLGGRAPGGADPDADAAIDRSVSATRTTIATAVDRAARAAARAPVTTRANTTYGRLLSADHPFRDALELRVYLAVQRALAGSEQRVRTVTTTASLPPVENATAARRAMRRVSVTGDGSVLRVTVRNVTLRASRDGQTVATERRRFEVEVRTPVVEVHERVERFERRLNRDPTGPGLGRRLTARLYAVVWARGYAQYGGAPIANVLANRHVELMTNGAILDMQAAQFGRADPSGEAALRRATAEVGLSDLLAAGGVNPNWAEYVLGENPAPPDGATPPDAAAYTPVDGEETTLSNASTAASVPTPTGNVTVDVGRTADRAFVDLLSGDAGWNHSLDRSVNRSYAARAKLVTAVDGPTTEIPAPAPPGADWTRQRTERSVERVVLPGDGPRPTVSHPWHRHETYTRRVVERWTVTAVWTDGDRRRTTTAREERTYRVGVSVVDRHAPAATPARPVVTVHERGGPLDGPNLRDTPGTAYDRLVDARGGPDAVARRVVAGERVRRVVRVPGDRPANLTTWVYADLTRLRERVREVSVNVSRTDLVTEMDADRRLLAAFERQRSALLSAPDRYRSVADKLRVAARAAYLRAVRERLRARTGAAERTRRGLNETLSRQTPFTLDEAGAIATAAVDDTASSDPDPDRDGRFTVEAAPTYLTLSSVTGSRVPSVRTEHHPLVARNHNVFAVPYGDAGDTVASALGGGGSETTSLRTAAKTLRRAERVAQATDNETLLTRRSRLRAAVRDRLALVEAGVATVVVRATGLSTAEAARAVGDAMRRWDTTGARATATVNGSASTAVAETIGTRHDLTPRATDELATRLRVGLSVAREEGLGSLSTRVPQALTAGTADVTRRVARGELRRLANERAVKEIKRVQEEHVDRLGDERVFAGLPLAPPFTPWYTTANVWHVSVRGEYARFTVRTRAGGPGEELAYSRDGQPVTVDVDGDGKTERLGRAERLSFSQETLVVIAVPPGRYGVGERDGNADERSAGWPTAGPTNDSRTGAVDGAGVGGRHAQDGSPARWRHVPRAADERAGVGRGAP